MRGDQALVNQIRRWLASTHPELATPPVRIAGGGPTRRARSLAESDHDARTIWWNDPSGLPSITRMGRTGQYRGVADRYPLHTLIHEMTHQMGPRYGDSPRSRFWEEGLAERVSSDLAPGFARSLKYAPGPSVKFEDGSTTDRSIDFSFPATAYPDQVRAVDGISFYAATRGNPDWGGGPDPSSSRAAMSYRRMLMAAGEAERFRRIKSAQRGMKQERERPSYAKDVARNVGRSVAATAPRSAQPATKSIWEKAAAAVKVSRPSRPAPAPPRPQNPRTVTSNQGRRTGRRPGDL